MPKFDVAHLREQGVDLIIIPLDSSFDAKSGTEQHEVVAELQTRASSAGLAGTVVPVWESSGRMTFLAPRNWHSFFQSINFQFIARNINRELYW